MSTESVRLRQRNLNLPDPLQFSGSILVVCFAEPDIVIISILNIRGEKVFQQQLQGDASYTFSCKIFTHVKKETAAPPGNPSDASFDAINCLNELSTDFCGLFNSMQFSDVILNVRGREFSAHKVILAARSEFFAAMF